MKTDIILKSKNIFTSTADATVSGGVAVTGNKIAAVLTDEQLSDWSADKVLDYGEKLIMPGLVDAHVHYFMGAMAASDHWTTEPTGSKSEAECVEIMKRFEKSHPDEKRLVGLGWFPAAWGDAPLPSKKSLDEAFPDKPVYMFAADFHTLWTNSKGLEESGITPDMKPQSGSVEVDENGEMTGILMEPDAYMPAMYMAQSFDDVTMKEINLGFLKHIASCGITSLSEISYEPYTEKVLTKYRSLKVLEKEELLTTRVHLYTEFVGHTDFTTALEWQKELESEKVRLSGVKALVDGVCSTYTGMLLEPYSDMPDTVGIGVPFAPREEIEKSAIAANKAGLPVRLHSIADGSVRLALDVFEASLKANGKHGLPNTIEHIEHIHPDDIPRFAELDVIASMQPFHLILDENEKPVRVGPERAKLEWPHRTLLDAGAKLAFGTDYPVVDFNPYPTIHAAVTRCFSDGSPASVNPEECVTLAETLKAYTAGGAAAYNRDDIGTLEEGKLADIIVIDRNLFDIPAADILQCSTVLTMFDGKIVYEK